MGKRIALQKSLMGANELSYREEGQIPIVYTIGETLVYSNETYNLNRLPSTVKGGKALYSYDVKFESDVYTLLNKKIELLDNFSFTVFGDLEYFVDLILTSINSIDTGWTKGTVPATEGQTLTFEDQDCRNVLNTLYEKFKIEWKVYNKTISFATEVGTITPYTFEYGRGKGAYTLTRQSLDSKNTVTRVYGRGSSKNLPQGYATKTLSLPEKYLQDTSEYPQIVEAIYSNEEVFPHFEGAIANVSANGFEFDVPTMDFNLNTQLNPGVAAKCIFKSGRLSGYSFEIASFNAASNTVRLVAYTAEDGTVYPNATALPEAGDTITYVDIYMPTSYVTNAESELRAQTQTYLDENKLQRVSYSLKLDPTLSKSMDLDVGDTVTLIDADYGINRTIRVKKITVDNVNYPTNIAIELSDYISVAKIDKVIAKQNSAEREVIKINATSQESARQNYQNQKILQEKIYDPDGYFDVDNIRPLSIDTLLLSVGAKSQNFKLSQVQIEPNLAGDANHMAVTAGVLIHKEIKNFQGGYDWGIVANDFDLLTPTTTYFLYAKCSKTTDQGIWVLSETSELSDQANDYYFWVGMLYPVQDDRRDYDMTNGMTFINGGTITTGRIQSSDEQNYIDLDLNKFRMGDQTSSLDWNVTAANAITLLNAGITGGYFQTATTGQRIRMQGSDNTLKFYDTLGALVLTLDDNISTDVEFADVAGLKVESKTGSVSLITSEGAEFTGRGLQFLPSATGYTTATTVNSWMNYNKNYEQSAGSTAMYLNQIYASMVVAATNASTDYSRIKEIGLLSISEVATRPLYMELTALAGQNKTIFQDVIDTTVTNPNWHQSYFLRNFNWVFWQTATGNNTITIPDTVENGVSYEFYFQDAGLYIETSIYTESNVFIFKSYYSGGANTNKYVKLMYLNEWKVVVKS